jgi:hypothetical protein
VHKLFSIFIFTAFSAFSANAWTIDFINGAKVGEPLPEHSLQYLGTSLDGSKSIRNALQIKSSGPDLQSSCPKAM